MPTKLKVTQTKRAVISISMDLSTIIKLNNLSKKEKKNNSRIIEDALLKVLNKKPRKKSNKQRTIVKGFTYSNSSVQPIITAEIHHDLESK